VGARAGVQVSKREFHSYIYLDYVRVEFYLVGDFPATSASFPCGNNSSFIAITSNMKKGHMLKIMEL